MVKFRTLAACLALSSCSAIVPSTAARLGSLDPLTADPAAMEMVVLLPAGLAVIPGSAKLELSAERGSDHLAGSFQLTDQPVTSGFDLPPGVTARRFSLAEPDVGRMRELQDQIATWKGQGNAKGSLGLGVGACVIGQGPRADARGSVLIRVKEDGPLLPLIADASLADLLGPEVFKAIKPCNGGE